jgi:hypothetical protein
MGALELFRAFNIQVLTLPSNVTHLLQMFDVGVAATFKKCLKKTFTKLRKTDRTDYVNDSSFYRYICVESMIQAWNASATGDLCRMSARKTGMVPFNVEAVLSSYHVTTDLRIGERQNLQKKVRKSLNINAKIITSDEFYNEYLTNFSHLLNHDRCRFKKTSRVFTKF